MTRRSVIEVSCDHCGGVEHIDAALAVETFTKVEVHIEGRDKSTHDLCTTCLLALVTCLEPQKREAPKKEVPRRLRELDEVQRPPPSKRVAPMTPSEPPKWG